MAELLGIPTQALFGQLFIGLINGAFYALLSLGLAVIFGLLNVINFAHGAQYMMGAFCAWLGLKYLGLNYWAALALAPLVVGASGMLIEVFLLRRIKQLDHVYGLLLTFGVALLIEGAFRQGFGAGGLPYAIPEQLEGRRNLGFMSLPNYRAWVIVASLAVCIATWVGIEKTRLGAYLRAATENPALVQAFGVRVPRMMTLTYGFGAALAALAGVMAAPIYQVSPSMGANTIIVVFAVVVIGGMGSIAGAIVSGFALGLIEGLTKVFYPQASSTVIFLIMVLVLLVKPAGLFGLAGISAGSSAAASMPGAGGGASARFSRLTMFLVAATLVAPFVGVYPVFVMKALCFALLAGAFNLLFGFAGLLSFGHAAFFGTAAYVTAYTMKYWGITPEVGIAAGTLAATALGAVFGWLAIRRQGIYFAMVTLALAQLLYFFYFQAAGFSGGEDGIQAVPRGRLFGLLDLERPLAIYYLVVAICMAGFAVIHRVVDSPFGQALKAIRENEPRAISLGYRVNRVKLLAFTLSAALAGLAGATKTIVLQLATLSDVHWGLSGEIVLMTLVGGVGTLLGPIVGAFVLVGIGTYLASLGSWITILQGAIFIVCVLTFRRGICGWIEDRAPRGWEPNAIGEPGPAKATKPDSRGD